eukprot:1399219-Pyramimonas_sp.AAC.1
MNKAICSNALNRSVRASGIRAGLSWGPFFVFVGVFTFPFCWLKRAICACFLASPARLGSLVSFFSTKDSHIAARRSSLTAFKIGRPSGGPLFEAETPNARESRAKVPRATSGSPGPSLTSPLGADHAREPQCLSDLRQQIEP